MTPDRQQEIQKSLMAFYTQTLSEAAIRFFNMLGYDSKKRPSRVTETLSEILEKHGRDTHAIQKDRIQPEKWEKSALLFQLTDEELSSKNTITNQKPDLNNPSSILFFAIELENRIWLAKEMVDIADEIDRHFVMPVVFLFKYGPLLTLLIRQKKGNSALIRNLRILHPTLAHTKMISDLDISNIKMKKTVSNCKDLYQAWFEALFSWNRDEKTFLQKSGMLVFVQASL